MCEPLSVGVHACRRAAVAPGKRVAVLGAGPIGVQRDYESAPCPVYNFPPRHICPAPELVSC